ncbi:MAG: mercury resistance system transport protein MerF [Deltaproteobacteria bacterium]|nr:mercury resistance system transport protein MerF [Deltaproteobacteria bacterium]
MKFTFPKTISVAKPHADRCCKTGLWGAAITALCCLTPLLVFLLGLVGLGMIAPYLDYLLVPLFGIFLLLGIHGWMQRGQIIRDKNRL